jgi:hypothetical protein
VKQALVKTHHVQCLCAACYRPVVVVFDPRSQDDPRNNACPHCHADVCNCPKCMATLNALRSGCRDKDVIGLSRTIVSWSESEGIEVVPKDATFH